MSRICENMSFEDYVSAEGLNASKFKKHYNSSVQQILAQKPFTGNSASDLGGVIHSLVLEPDMPTDHIVEWTGGDKRCKAWKDFKAKHENDIILDNGQVEALPQVVRNVHADSEASRLLNKSSREVSIFWEAECGAKCKARLDVMKDGGMIIADVKSTAQINKFKFWGQVRTMGYWLQAGHYVDGAMIALGLSTMPEFWFICAETIPPYSVVCRPMNPEYLAFAIQEARTMVARLHIAEVTGSIETLADIEGIEEVPMPSMFKEKDTWEL